MQALLTILALGFVLGLRHATDPDHVVAVSTLVSRERSLRSAAVLGAYWGLGHCITLFVVGGAIIAFGLVVPPRLGLGLDLCVALMLIALGIANLASAKRPTAPSTRGRPARSLAVGVVHGLAGSAGVALLVLSTIHASAWAIGYLLVFGVATLVGMVLLTGLFALPFSRAPSVQGFQRWLVAATGVASIAFGVVVAHRIVVEHGIFAEHPRWTPE